MSIRPPAVAGYFYAASLERLREQIAACFQSPLGPGKEPTPAISWGERVVAGIVPHAGYMYSGPVAASFYAELATDGCPPVIVLVGPNHTGIGAPIAIYPRGSWETPLGSVEVDEQLAQEIRSRVRLAKFDTYAHIQEHSLEVQLPFLQYLFGNTFRIVPITILLQEAEVAEMLAQALYDLSKQYSFIIIASSDFTHYEPHDVAARKDREAIDRILQLDVRGFFELVHRHALSICGYCPIGVATLFAKYHNASPRLLNYKTSGDITGDRTAVVGYASIVFERK